MGTAQVCEGVPLAAGTGFGFGLEFQKVSQATYSPEPRTKLLKQMWNTRQLADTVTKVRASSRKSLSNYQYCS